MPQRWKAEAAPLGITFIWGATFVVVKNALADASTLLFLTLRFLLAGATLAYLARHIYPDRRLVGASLVCGSALFCGYLFQTLGLRLTTPTKSAFITGFSVVLVFAWLTSWAVLGEKMSDRASLGALVIPAGIVIAQTTRSSKDNEQHIVGR